MQTLGFWISSKVSEKKVAGTTLETPIAMPIIVMLSPMAGLVKKNTMSGG